MQFEFCDYREMITGQPGYSHPAAFPLDQFHGAAEEYLVQAAGWRGRWKGKIGLMVAAAAVGGAVKIEDIGKDGGQQGSPVVEVASHQAGQVDVQAGELGGVDQGPYLPDPLLHRQSQV